MAPNDFKELNTYLAGRHAHYLPHVRYFRGQNWFSDGGKMYLISEKLSSTEKFKTTYVMMRFILSKLDEEAPDYSTYYDYIEHQADKIDADDFINKVIGKIIENDQKQSALSFVKNKFFSKKEENVDRMGCWLMPSDYCIDYSSGNVEYIADIEKGDISCFDKIFFTGEPRGLFTPETPNNFRTLCYNVFGVETDEAYYNMLGLVAKSFKAIPGDQSIILVKGKGGSGKSSWTSLITSIFNELIVEINEAVFNPRTAAYDFTSQKRAMANAHVIIIDESDDRAKDNTIMKKVTSGTALPYRELQTNGGTVQVMATVIYFSNSDIDLSNIDSGTMRRLNEFQSPDNQRKIDWNKKKYKDFKDIFLAEKDGIIKDFFDALKNFVEIDKPMKVGENKVATSLYDMFFYDQYEFDPKKGILRDEFLDYCKRSAEFRGTKKRRGLIAWMEERGAVYGWQNPTDKRYYIRGIKEKYEQPKEEPKS